MKVYAKINLQISSDTWTQMQSDSVTENNLLQIMFPLAGHLRKNQ